MHFLKGFERYEVYVKFTKMTTDGSNEHFLVHHTVITTIQNTGLSISKLSYPITMRSTDTGVLALLKEYCLFLVSLGSFPFRLI